MIEHHTFLPEQDDDGIRVVCCYCQKTVKCWHDYMVDTSDGDTWCWDCDEAQPHRADWADIG